MATGRARNDGHRDFVRALRKSLVGMQLITKARKTTTRKRSEEGLKVMNLKLCQAESGKQPCRPALEIQFSNASGQTCVPLTREVFSWFRFSLFRDSYS